VRSARLSDRFLDALTAIKARHDVKNGATALMLMLDIVEEALGASTKEANGAADPQQA